MHGLQERYNKWVTISHLHDDEWKEENFSRFVLEEQHDLPDYYAFAEAIRLKPDIARIITLRLALKGGVLSVACVLK